MGSGQCSLSSYRNLFMYFFLIVNYLVLVTVLPTSDCLTFSVFINIFRDCLVIIVEFSKLKKLSLWAQRKHYRFYTYHSENMTNVIV
jgi:hypothetical protein